MRRRPIGQILVEKEAITEEELEDQLLEKGMTDFAQVGLIVLETTGKLVYLTPEQAKRLKPEMLAEAA